MKEDVTPGYLASGESTSQEIRIFAYFAADSKKIAKSQIATPKESTVEVTEPMNSTLVFSIDIKRKNHLLFSEHKQR
ncbi:hypothetical protein C0J52_16842 [Blattella germanica]|nr:hypothetical protein C0J52_16842 [Blattella germanica]